MTNWFDHPDANNALAAIQAAGRRANGGDLDEALLALETARKSLARYRAKIRAAWRRREKAGGNWCRGCGRFSKGAEFHRRSCPTKAPAEA